MKGDTPLAIDGVRLPSKWTHVSVLPSPERSNCKFASEGRFEHVWIIRNRHLNRKAPWLRHEISGCLSLTLWLFVVSLLSRSIICILLFVGKPMFHGAGSQEDGEWSIPPWCGASTWFDSLLRGRNERLSSLPALDDDSVSIEIMVG